MAADGSGALSPTAEKKPHGLRPRGRMLVGRPGFEPGTNRLKVYCSTN